MFKHVIQPIKTADPSDLDCPQDRRQTNVAIKNLFQEVAARFTQEPIREKRETTECTSKCCSRPMKVNIRYGKN